MSRTIQTNGESLNGSEKSNWTTIRRTFIERGIRPVNSFTNKNQSSSSPTITTITKQHEDEQRELQELNSKLSTYLDHVHNLETYNGQLLAELDTLREKWGVNSEKVNATYAPQLQVLRYAIDNSLRDQILQELQIKQFEYDIGQTQQRINAFDNDRKARLNEVEQELKNSIDDLENIKKQFDRRSIDLVQQRTKLENLGNEFDGLQVELLNHRLERIMVGNEVQTLQEEIAFQDAIYQTQREEILSLNIPAIDLSKFYRNELARAITDIRQDFDILSKSQVKELEEYYRIKTEEIQKKAAEDNERKRLLKTEIETADMHSNLSTYLELNEEYKQLKLENNQLQTDFNDTLEDLTRIRDENTRENTKYDLQWNQLREEIDNRQAIISGTLENNVSLRFELSTYRNLLNSEEKRLNRIEEKPTSAADQTQQVKDYSIQKMAVKKTATGPIAFDSIDFINDCVIITYDRSTGSKQSLENWTVRRQNDQQVELVYQFPSSFVLRPRQTIRILSKRSPPSTRSSNEDLIADQIETWGQGQVMVTRLIDNNKEEKANIIQTRLPT